MDTLGKRLWANQTLVGPQVTETFRLKNVILISVQATYTAAANGDLLLEVSSEANGEPDAAPASDSWVELDRITLNGANPAPLNHMWKDGQAAYNYVRCRWIDAGGNGAETMSIGIITKGDE